MEDPVDTTGWAVNHAERHKENGWVRVTIQTPTGDVVAYTQTPPEVLSRAAAQMHPLGRLFASAALETVAGIRRSNGRK